MFNLFGKLINMLKFDSDDEDDGYDDYLAEEEIKEAEREKSRRTKEEPAIRKVSEPKAVPVPVRSEETKPRVIADKGRVIPVRTNKEFELKVVKPANFSDCQDICDILLNGDAVIINLEGFDPELSQRVMDFVSGTVYAIRGTLSPVSKLIYIASPENVSISGDVAALLGNGSSPAPTFSNGF